WAPSGARSEALLGPAGVEVAPRRAGRLLGLAREPTGLVVGDAEPSVRVDVEAVDHTPQAEVTQVGLEGELDAHRRDPIRVLELEVPPDQPLGVRPQLVHLHRGELERSQLRLPPGGLPRPLELAQ